MKFCCIYGKMKKVIKSVNIKWLKVPCFVLAFVVNFSLWYLLGMFGYHSFNPERELIPCFIEYFIWSIESGDWFHFFLISFMFGVLSVFILKWIMLNWKYWKQLWRCEV